MTPQTLQDAIRYFSDFDNCQRTMIALRWFDGKVRCPYCQSEKVTYLPSGRVWRCASKHKRRKFSLKIGTIFEDSPIGLDKWFTAMWLIANCKNGVSSYEIARDIHVTQKTAWFMDHRIRLAMHAGSFDKMTGEVEADETFIGGLARFMHKDQKAKITGTGGAGKVAVMGLLERHGPDKHSRVKARVVRNVQRETLQKEIREHVTPGSEMMTDAWVGYGGLEPDYTHKVIDHAEAYVQGNVHTNGIENFWSCLKRGLKGTYISVEPFHLFRYVDEQAFRFNHRKATDGARFVEVLGNVTGRRLTYEHLIGKSEPQLRLL
jgi:transposase-like protein